MPDERHISADVTIRPAVALDAPRVCDVLTQSVREICGPDYGNDAEILDSWCDNKTPEILSGLICDPDNFFIVAELADQGVVAAALYKRPKSNIDLCYVARPGLHHGIGSAMLAAIEAEARRLGQSQITLSSTITAREFYRRNGYEFSGVQMYWGKILCFPMRKNLSRK